MKLYRDNFYSFTGEKKYILCCRWGVLKRYLALLLWCFVSLGLYFCYDVPGSLQNQFMATYNLNSLQFSYLYSIYFWPNVVMCLIGGFLIDRVFGPKLGLIIYSGIATLGMMCFVIGGNIDSFVLMLTGRFILGIGCETAIVALNNYTILWFSGKELNMVFAIVFNIGRFGSSLVFEVSEPVLKIFTDLGQSEHNAVGNTLIALSSVTITMLAAPLIVAFMNPDNEEEAVEQKSQESNEPEEPKKSPQVKPSDILSFQLQYWLVCIIFCIHLNCFYSFLGLSQESLTKKFHVSNAEANRYVSFSNCFSAGLAPFLGILIDKFGRNLSYVTFAVIAYIISLTILAFTDINPYVSMFFLAISTASMLSATWALISYTIPEYQIGTAFGLLQALLNIMLSLGTIATGAITTAYGPKVMEIFLIALLVVTTPLLLWSWITDIKYTKVLNMSAKQRTAFLEKRNKKETDVERKISTISNSYSKDVNPKKC